jgi:hypothetical protein
MSFLMVAENQNVLWEDPQHQYQSALREACRQLGMVYVLRDDVAGRLKIGWSFTPFKRKKVLQIGCSVFLRMIALLYGGEKLERGLHKVFAARCVGGNGLMILIGSLPER